MYYIINGLDDLERDIYMKIRKVWGSANTIKAATSTPHIMIIPGNRTCTFSNNKAKNLLYYLVK